MARWNRLKVLRRVLGPRHPLLGSDSAESTGKWPGGDPFPVDVPLKSHAKVDAKNREGKGGGNGAVKCLPFLRSNAGATANWPTGGGPMNKMCTFRLAHRKMHGVTKRNG
jgi:hypothetical protein